MVGMGLVVLYYLTPHSIIDKIIEKTIFIVRYLFSDKVETLEENIRKTFQIKVRYPIPKRSIHIWSPHGVTVLTGGIHNVYKIGISDIKPSRFVVHSAGQYWPIAKDILRYFKTIPSHYTTIKDTIQKESVGISLGGFQEMSRCSENILQIFISKRKGIFKIALETGTPIVPILTYGENKMFPETDSTILKQLNEISYKIFKVAVPQPSWKAICNWFKLSYMHLDPIVSHTGKPIVVKKIENPSDKHIVKLRNVYIQRMKDLFAETNDGTYTLEIL